ncbi:MAG: histidine kinase dimerization/phosphoacceptor domain -containing protein [Bacteroidota bacterium]
MRRLLLIICCWLPTVWLLAERSPVVVTEVKEQEIGASFWLWQEGAGPREIGRVQARFAQDKTLGIPLAQRQALADTATYWLAATLRNDTPQDIWWLRLSFQSITHGQVWVLGADGRVRTRAEIGIFARRTVNDGFLTVGPKFNQLPLDIPQGETVQIFARVQNAKRWLAPETSVNLLPYTPRVKTTYDTQAFLLGLMAGVFILLILFSATLFWLTRERSYSDYVWFLLSAIVWSVFSYGMLRDWLIESWPSVAPKYVFLLRSLVIFVPYAYLRFIWSFGNLDALFPSFSRWLPRLRKLVIGLFFLDWGWLLYSNFNFVYSNIITMVAGLTVLVIVWSLVPRLYQHRTDKMIRLILYAVTVLTLGLISPILRMSMNGFRSIDGYEVAIAQVADIAIFATGLGWKFRDFLRLSAENELIRQLLGEKDMLLREIHHRVKNNLQVVSSLLRLQALHAKDEESKSALRESYQRLSSMSMIHEKLYQQDQVTQVNLRDYFGRLANSLFTTYQIDHQQITLATDIDPIELDLETVMPLGLLLNELLSNALKHAFPDGRAGEITVQIKRQAEGLFLSVADNGQGMRNGPGGRQDTFGHQLVMAFAQKLDGELTYETIDGTTITLVIPQLPISTDA